MALAKTVYSLLFRRTSTFAVTIVVGAVFFERVFDQGGDAVFEQLNRGVSVVVKQLMPHNLTFHVEDERTLALD